ncbi:MAG: Lrp/AsnC family transcriptional regulator [Clostridia bacterium]|nr:Lrp/AsnC family transcriptional regulator [Clostridia bacterium]
MDILKLLETNSKLTPSQLAVMCDMSVEAVNSKIKEYEEKGIILGYKTIIDWDKTEREYVSAMIELKVAPQKDLGFDRIAERICLHPEVQSVSLMSGGYDLLVVIEGKTMREVSNFVFNRLATMDGVVSTATHFMLRKYKDKGVIYNSDEEDKRGNIL